MHGLDEVFNSNWLFFSSVMKNSNFIHLQSMGRLIGLQIKWGLVLTISVRVC